MLARTPGENIDIVSNMHMGVLIVSLVWFHFFQCFFFFLENIGTQYYMVACV